MRFSKLSAELFCAAIALSFVFVTRVFGIGVPTITPSGPTTFCAGGSVTLTSSAANNQWSLNGSPIGGATNQTYIATTSGNYTVTDTTTSATSAATTVTVNPLPATPAITPSGPTTFCTGDSVTLTSSSPSGNQWFVDGNFIGGATNQSYIASTSGSYTVVVTTTGCSSSASAATVVTVNPIPATPTITPDGPTTFCAGGSVTLTSSSATGNQWYVDGNPIGGQTNQSYVATGSGSYTVVVTTTGCSSAFSAATLVTVNPLPPTPAVNAGGPTTFCAGDSVTLTSSSATGNQWFINGSPIGGATNNNYIATASGNYTVVVTTIGCSSFASAATVVTVNPIPATPTISAGGPTTICAGDSVTLTSSSATGNQWFLDGNPIGGATNQNYIATAAGNYTVLVTTSGCSSAASAATSVTVNPLPATPTITPGGPTTFCSGGSVTLTSSAASGNQWYVDGNPIGGATNQQYNATASGNYTVTVTDGNSCSSVPSAAITVTVNLPATPTITPGGPTSFCTGGSVTLTSSAASGNQWYFNGNPIGGATNQQYVATASGNYTLVAIDGNSCSSATSAVTTVTVNPIPATPTVTVGGPTTFCAGGSVTLTSSVASGNQWYLNGNPINGATNQQYDATASGIYTVVDTALDCSSAASAATTVTVNSLPTTPIVTPDGPTTFCVGGSVTLTSSAASGNQWFLNGNSINGATSQQYVVTATGDYTVVVTDGNSCSSATAATTTVTVNLIPATPIIAPGGPTTFCAGDSVTLTSSAATGNQWYLNGNPITGATSQQYVATASGDYTVVDTALGCSSATSTATTVMVNPIPAVPTITAGGPLAFEPGGSVTLTSSSTTGNQWFLNGVLINSATDQNYVAAAAGAYTVQVTSPAGCFSALSEATNVIVTKVTLTSGPAAAPNPASLGQTVTFNAVAEDSSGSAVTLSWDIAGTSASGSSPTRVFTVPGTYTATVTAVNLYGLTASASVQVIVVAPAVGAGSDTDGDGFSDDFEIAAGTSPSNAADSPTGGLAPVKAALSQSKLSIKLNFAKTASDSISFSGTLPVPAGYNSAGKTITVDVGGVVKAIPLDEKGKSKEFKLLIKSKNGVVAAQTAKFSVKLSKGIFAASLADEGLTNANVNNARANVFIQVIYDGTIYQATQDLTYTAKAEKTGAAKVPR